MKEKLKLSCFIIILIIMLINIKSYAATTEETEFKPIVDNSSFVVTNDNVTVGDTVKIEVSITNVVNPLKHVKVYFTKPVTRVDTDVFYFEYNTNTGLYETNITIDNNWQNGEYIIDSMFFSDGTNGEGYWNNKNPNSLGYNSNADWAKDLSGCSFSVYGTTADTEIPVIDGSSLKMSKRQVINGDTIKYSVKITDNVGIKNASIELINKSSENSKFKEIELSYNSTTGLYDGYLTIDSSLLEGLWYIYYIQAEDKNSNYIFLYNSNVAYGTNKYNWSSSIYTFYNYQSNPDSILTKDSLIVDKNSITSGETVNISLEAMNYLGIDNIKIYYKRENINTLQSVDAQFSKTNSTGSNNGIEYYYNEYIATLNFNEYGYNGKWIIERIDITNTRNATTSIYNSELTNNLDDTDLSSGKFETYGLINDSTNPNIIDYSISSNIAMYGASITLKVNAVDELSGIKNVIVNYTIPNGATKDYYLSYTNGMYSCSINYDEQEKVGNYKANYILAEDKAGNITKITENLVGLNFGFYSQINVIAPSLYLNTITSYTMEAIIYPSSEKITGVTWSSSDTSIASINSTTGVLSTKSKEGTVTITATANDGSGIYGKINLIVSDATVKVGETVSLGNSEYVKYETVNWIIDDETILSKTGSTGYISINGNYKHNIKVKGEKEGTTILKMLTPSGDILASSTVYVYNPITAISSEITNLTMNKNDIVKINANVSYHSSTTANAMLYYVSENEKVAIVNQNGEITAIGSGQTNIKIYSQYYGAYLIIPVTVKVYTTGINVDSENVSLNEEKITYQIKYSIEPDDASDKGVNFESSNEKIITVDSNGVITAVRNGSATIKIKTNDGKQTKTINVTVSGLKRNLDILEFEKIENISYTGKEITPNVIIKDDTYILVKNTDYTLKYENNINAGTAKVIITGINNYKGNKTIEFNINKATPNIKYNASNKTVNYDGNNYGINLSITSPSNVVVKYADLNGAYTLNEMPLYKDNGTYTIKFKLYINENYTDIIDSRILTINKGNINNSSSDYEGIYDGKEHSINIKVDIPNYDIKYSIDGKDYTLNTLPTFNEVGEHTVNYKVTNKNYKDLISSNKVKIYGIKSIDSTIEMRKNILVIKDYSNVFSNICNRINVFAEAKVFNHLDSNKNLKSNETSKTGDYLQLTINGTKTYEYLLSILGDVNGDGKISALDYVKIKNHIMKTNLITSDVYLISADVNDDGKISALDYVRIKNRIMNGGK